MTYLSVVALGIVAFAQAGALCYICYLLSRQHDRTEARILASDRTLSPSKDPMRERVPKIPETPEDVKRRVLAAKRHAEESYFGE